MTPDRRDGEDSEDRRRVVIETGARVIKRRCASGDHRPRRGHRERLRGPFTSIGDRVCSAPARWSTPSSSRRERDDVARRIESSLIGATCPFTGRVQAALVQLHAGRSQRGGSDLMASRDPIELKRRGQRDFALQDYGAAPEIEGVQVVSSSGSPTTGVLHGAARLQQESPFAAASSAAR